MKTVPKDIFGEYKKAADFKNTVGTKGIAEQSRINERFYRGDQWYGVAAGGERPLVRHNVIKRIGDYKMSQIMLNEDKIRYAVDDITSLETDRLGEEELKERIIKSGKSGLSGVPGNAELSLMAKALSRNREICAKRLGLANICAKALKDSYIKGTGIVYTYWDTDTKPNIGDIGCEVLSVNDVFFADPYEKNIQNQPYIIISGFYNTDFVKREAEHFGGEVSLIEKDSAAGKVQVLTKLYKNYKSDGTVEVMCVKVTENAVVRKPFVTMLHRYPLALFCFEEREDIIYGDSEITYLIPNQIAINRMITANVWSSMSTGMPIMVVNGDTVTADITNDPGQIIKIYGSNEDVKGAINFISPPDYSKDFSENINNLIDNTLTQSGATAAVLGDEILNNATALSLMRNSTLLSLQLTKSRYKAFLNEIAAVWADFFMSCYGERNLKMTSGKDVFFVPFDSNRYKNAVLVIETEEKTEETEEKGKDESK